MSSIDHFDLRSFDLNLLVAFDALMQERSVTRAASRLKIGQPSMSHSLSTLRVLLQDQLFVRVGSTMRPTSRAASLAVPVRDALTAMQAALHASAIFDPATERRTMRIGFSSEVELLLMPSLSAELRHTAPGVRLIGRQTEREDAHRMLDEGTLDIAVGCFEAGAQRHRTRRLFEQSLSCVFNPELVVLDDPVPLMDYLRLSHALVTWKGTLNGCLEAALAEIDADLNVVVAVSEFLTVLATVADAPLIATVPTRMALREAPRFGLRVSPVPLPLHVPAVAMVWSAQTDGDPASRWLRDLVAALLAVAGESSPSDVRSMTVRR